MRSLRRESGQQMFTLSTSVLFLVVTAVEADEDVYIWTGTLFYTPTNSTPSQVYHRSAVFTHYTLAFENRFAANILAEARNVNPNLSEELDILLLGI